MPCRTPQDFPIPPLCWFLCVPPPFSWHHPPSVEKLPNLSLKSSNSSIFTCLFYSRIDALWFTELANLHLLLLSHWVPDCLVVLLTFYLLCKDSHFRPHRLTAHCCNPYWFCNQTSLHDHSAQIGWVSINICSMLLWLETDNINCSLQLRALDSLENVADLCAIVHTTVAIIYTALHYGMLLCVERVILVHPTVFSCHHSGSSSAFFLQLQPA